MLNKRQCVHVIKKIDKQVKFLWHCLGENGRIYSLTFCFDSRIFIFDTNKFLIDSQFCIKAFLFHLRTSCSNIDLNQAWQSIYIFFAVHDYDSFPSSSQIYIGPVPEVIFCRCPKFTIPSLPFDRAGVDIAYLE